MELSAKHSAQLKDLSTALDAEHFTIVATTVEKGVETKDFQLEIAKEEFEQKMATLEATDFKKASISSIKSDLCNHVAVSGLTEESLKAMKTDGISTASVIQTGEKEYQAIVKVNAPKNPMETEKLEEIQRVLNERYGKGVVEKDLAMPGLPYKDEKYICNVNTLNPGSPSLGIARLHERLQETANLYPAKEQPGREQPKESKAQENPEAAKAAPIIETPGQPPLNQEPPRQQEAEKIIGEKSPDIVASILAALKAIINTVIKTVTLGTFQPFPNAIAQKPVVEQQVPVKEPFNPEKVKDIPLKDVDSKELLSKIPPAPAFAPGVENALFGTPQNPETVKAQIAREIKEQAKAAEKTQQKAQQKGKGHSKTMSKSRSGPSL